MNMTEVEEIKKKKIPSKKEGLSIVLANEMNFVFTLNTEKPTSHTHTHTHTLGIHTHTRYSNYMR